MNNSLSAIILLSICFLSVLVNIIIVIVFILKSKKRVIYLKERSINILGIWKEKWEINNDELLIELYKDNIRLEKENKLLLKKCTNMSILNDLISMI